MNRLLMVTFKDRVSTSFSKMDAFKIANNVIKFEFIRDGVPVLKAINIDDIHSFEITRLDTV